MIVKTIDHKMRFMTKYKSIDALCKYRSLKMKEKRISFDEGKYHIFLNLRIKTHSVGWVGGEIFFHFLLVLEIVYNLVCSYYNIPMCLALTKKVLESYFTWF